MNLVSLKDKMINCKKCALSKTRTQVVFGEGPEGSDLMLIGEAPGGHEDMSGKPFTGDAGKNLDRFLELVGIDRDSLFITNTVRCRPTTPSSKAIYNGYANRKPSPDEIAACSEWLDLTIKIIKPKVIVTLGGVPLQRIAGVKSVGQVHGKRGFSERYQCWIFPLYHPAAIIYKPDLKEVYEEDLKKLGRFLRYLKSEIRPTGRGSESLTKK